MDNPGFKISKVQDKEEYIIEFGSIFSYAQFMKAARALYDNKEVEYGNDKQIIVFKRN